MPHIPPTSCDAQAEDRTPSVDLSGIMAEVGQAITCARPARPQVPPPGEAAVSDNAQAIPWPPGRAGVIARFLYASSYSPIPEVAITAALGLLAGVCGRAYR